MPAATYTDALLIRTTLRAVAENGKPWSLFNYTWIVPNVGEVAYITSEVNEQQRVFTRASNFYRLTRFK